MTKNISKIGLYIGLGAGLVLFVISGLLPGSFIGGSVGVSIAKYFIGGNLEPSLLPRLIVGASMLSGIVASGLLLIISSSSLGWLIGYGFGWIIESARPDVVGGAIKNEAAVDSN